MKKQTYFSQLLLLIIVSFIFVFDWFWTSALPQTFDAWTHVMTMATFARSIEAGAVPVAWIDGVANYGLPLGHIAHQLPAYTGALFMISLRVPPVVAYALTSFLITASATILMFLWLKKYYTPWISAAGAVLFCFNPYRILNMYTRGALPEMMAQVFLVGIGWALESWFTSRKARWLVVLSLLIAGVALSHPMMLVVGVVFFTPFVLLRWPPSIPHIKSYLQLSIFGVLGLVMAGYFLLPLVLENKYFYYGSMSQQSNTHQFLQLNQFWQETWHFNDPAGIGIRENRPQIGSPEALIMIIAVMVLLLSLLKKRSFTKLRPQLSWLGSLVILIIFVHPVSEFLYQSSAVLASIQYPWRMLTALSILPALWLGWLLSQLPRSTQMYGAGLIIILVAAWRIPTLYGKNFVAYPLERYLFSVVNPHGTNMNPVWTGNSWEYPVKTQKAEIVEGKGYIIDQVIHPTYRRYHLQADEPIRLSDNTFYFPGWQLTIDDQPAVIEFQDPNFRGVITYLVPTGEHVAELTYTDTKIRLLGKALTIIGTAMWLIVVFYIYKTQRPTKQISRHQPKN